MSGVGAAPWGTGVPEVVGTGDLEHGGGTGSGKGIKGGKNGGYVGVGGGCR